MLKDWELSELRFVREFEDHDAYGIPLSGRGLSDKLDVGFKSERLFRFLGSNKWTEKDSASITKKDWSKDKKQAAMMGKIPIRRVEFSTGEKFILIEQERFLELIQ